MTDAAERSDGVEYSRAERWALVLVAVAGLVGVNGAFLYGVAQPGLMEETLANPVAVAFMAEAFVLMGVLAYLMAKWGVARLRWPWFVGLSLLGSMAFALPVVLLWPRTTDTRPTMGAST